MVVRVEGAQLGGNLCRGARVFGANDVQLGGSLCRRSADLCTAGMRNMGGPARRHAEFECPARKVHRFSVGTQNAGLILYATQARNSKVV